ncbi:MAG: Yip1 family protein [Halobellus sp.]|uniref:Yip1 family protein n=1 Tax=Halobellus sp. TaxID=1979212 RepID=UPI0035D43637
MLSALQRAVTQPATFFETESDDPSLGPPVVVVGLVAVAGILGSIPTVLAVNRALPAEAGLFAAIGFLFGSITAVIGPFVSWVIVVTLLFIGAVLAGGNGEFRDLFALVGWGFAPRIVVPLVGGVVAFLLLSGTNFSDPQQARRLSQMATTGTFGLVSQGVNAVMFVWAGWMWTHAIASTQNLTTRTAGVISGAVVVLQILVNVGLSLLSASLV